MSDAILAGLSGLGDAFKSAIPTISAVQEMEHSRTRLGMEQEKQSWEKEKFLREKAQAEAPVNFSQMIGNNEFRDGAIKGMMDYYKTKHPETYQQFHKDEASGDLYGPAYLKDVIRTDASHDADFFKKVYDNIAPRATAKVVEAQQNLDRIKEKLLKVHPNIDSAKETPEYKEAEALLNSTKQAQSKIAEASIAVEKSKEEMKAAIEKDKMYGPEAQQMQAIKDKAALERTVSGASISAGASKYSADTHAASAKEIALINRGTQLEKVDRQGEIIIKKANIAAGAKGGSVFDKKPKTKVDKETSAKTYNDTIVASLNQLPMEERVSTARNILSKVTDQKARVALAKELVSRGIINIEDINQ